MGVAIFIFLLTISHPCVYVCFCLDIIEFSEYQESLYLDGSFSDSNECQMSWFFVLFTLVLLSAQRNGNWLYSDSPEFSWKFRNRYKYMPCPQEAFHVAEWMELKRIHRQGHHDCNQESCLYLPVVCVLMDFLHGNHIPSVKSCHLFSSVSKSLNIHTFLYLVR